MTHPISPKSLTARAVRQRASAIGLCLALGLSGLAHAFGVTPAGGTPTAASANPLAGNAEAARKGEELFGRNCQQCHNTRGHGGKCPQLVRGAWAPGGPNSDKFMFDTISKGRPNTQMGSFGMALGEEEIWQIVTFLREEAVRVKAAARKATDDDDSNWY
ncbi:MAG: c-type cytochrome [Proteobacteria bacterium]|nr:c-type cytochrome [Pseudomonadota bacterium]